MSAAQLTILLPAFNAESVIGGAIQSILHQTFHRFELWVLENGSTDRTADVARAIPDPRIRVFQLGPVGFQGALQYGLENATSTWVARMDADDLALPSRLELQMSLLQARPDLGFVGTDYAILTPFGHILEVLPPIQNSEIDTTRLGSRRRRFADPSAILNRRMALDSGGIDPEFSMGDVPLFFRILKQARGWQLEKPLYVYRIRPSSMSKKKGFHDESYRARLKYSPTSSGVWNSSSSTISFWEQIARYALIAGDLAAARAATQKLKAEGPEFQMSARKMRLRCLIAKLAIRYYAYQNRERYVRRIDWETLLENLGGRLAEENCQSVAN